MGRPFVVSDAGVTVVGATTLIFINPVAAPNFNLEFLRLEIGQSANATSAQQRMQVVTQVTAFPTLTSATPAKLRRADPNVSIIVGGTAGAAGTCGTNASAEGAGAKTTVWNAAFNVLDGYLWVPTPKDTLVMPAGSASGMGLYLPVAPGTLTNWAFAAVYDEV